MIIMIILGFIYIELPWMQYQMRMYIFNCGQSQEIIDGIAHYGHSQVVIDDIKCIECAQIEMIGY